MLVGAMIVGNMVRRSHRKQDEMLDYSLTGRSRLHPQDSCDRSPEVRTYLQERALIVASLLARGSSEIYLQHSQLAPGFEVVTRQIQNALLRDHGVWDKLERAEADLASAADGFWTVEQRDQVFIWCEQLRLLRWVLGVDAELVWLAHCPTLDFWLSHDVLRWRKGARSMQPLVKPWDVRIQRDIALAYTARVVAELKGRGFIADGPELEGWADEFRAQSLGASTDYLADTKTIAELDEPALRQLGTVAATRERYCAYLVELLNAVQPFPFSSLER